MEQVLAGVTADDVDLDVRLERLEPDRQYDALAALAVDEQRAAGDVEVGDRDEPQFLSPQGQSTEQLNG